MDTRGALLSHPRVGNAEVIDLPDMSARPVALVVADGLVTGLELRQHLLAELAGTDVPDIIAVVPEIELSVVRGQLDELPGVYRFVPPRSEVEKWLAALWAEMLGGHDLGIRDDFLELGGDSVSAISTLTEIHDYYGAEISIADFFSCATIERLAALVESAR
jgi:acyl carrier protein